MPMITGRGSRVAVIRPTRAYVVLKDAHIADARCRSQFYAAADEGEEPTLVRLTVEDAKYWLLEGVIAEIA